MDQSLEVTPKISLNIIIVIVIVMALLLVQQSIAIDDSCSNSIPQTVERKAGEPAE